MKIALSRAKTSLFYLITTFAASESGYIIKRRSVVTKQLLRAMKLTGFLIVVACLHVSANGIGQHVTLSVKDASLQQVFTEIIRQSGTSIIYNNISIKNAKPVTLEVKNASVEQVLDLCLKGQPFSYAQEKGFIIVKFVSPESSGGLNPLLSEQDPGFFNTPPPIIIKGKVLNEKGEPVVASVIVKGTKNGVTTDNYGNFLINNVDENATLIISGINIETQEIKVDRRNEIIIAVRTRIAEEEIIVKTNYYSTTKRLSTGNISKVTSKEIGDQPVTSLLMALQGRVAGLEITPSSGTPGSAPTIHIRGTNSLRGTDGYTADRNNLGNNPLYIIDGVPINAARVESVSFSFMNAGFDPLNFINPQNVESIEVLKDGDATAIYGSRGANGVILITTKQGKAGAKTSFDVNAYKGAGKVAKKLELLTTEQYLQMRREAFTNDNVVPDIDNAADLLLWDTTRNTDWQDLFLGGTAEITDVNTTLSGGNANTSFRLGGGYHKETMVFPGDEWFTNATVNASLNHIATSRKFRAGFSFNYGSTRNKLFDDGAFILNATLLPPNAPKVYNEDGKLNWERKPSGERSWDNPMASLVKENKSLSSNIAVNANLSYEVIEGLSFKTGLGFTQLNGNEISKLPLSSIDPAVITSEYIAVSYFGNNQRFSWNIEPQINYDKKIKKHSLNIVLGSTLQDSRAVFQRIRARYSSDEFMESLQSATTVQYEADEDGRYRYTSLLARLGYNYQEKYILNLTGRRDGSSRFGDNKKYGNFGSIAAAWIFSDEPFSGKYLDFLDFGKIRTSYGITGGDQIADYKYYSLYNVGQPYNNITTLYPAGLHNPDFAWEVTKKFEAGLQLGFFKNRINFDLSWYHHRSSNQLVQYPLSAIVGFSSVLTNFGATVENAGFEAVIATTNINRKNFKWTTSFNISVPKNRLVKFDGIENSPYAERFKVGESVNIQRLYTWLGVNPQTGANRYLDLNKDGVLNDADKSFMYPNDPKAFGGINNTIRYKGMELSFVLQFSSRYAKTFNSLPVGLISNQRVDIWLERWRKPGDITTVQKPSQNYFNDWTLFSNSNYSIDDAAFIRLKTLSISYSINKKTINSLHMQDARIFIQGQNLFTLSKLKNLDPETLGGLPPLRMLTFGLQVKI